MRNSTPFRACAMHPAIIIGTVRSLWTWLWGRYHVPQNAFLVDDGIDNVTDDSSGDNDVNDRYCITYVVINVVVIMINWH